MLVQACMLVAVHMVGTACAASSKPHIFSILQDDLGFADTGIYSDTNAAAKAAAPYTPNITALAREGIALTHHYVHWHCSPTRRTFLSGRLPIHHGEQLSKVDTDDMDMRWTWLPQKLQSAGYRTHGFGKEHTGFKSVHQLWSNRGFTSSVGSLLTGGNYYYARRASLNNGPRWQDQHPIYNDTQFVDMPGNCKEQVNTGGMCTQEYSTALWGQLAVQAVEQHKLPAPLYIHLCFQAVHTPYDAPPVGWRGPSVPPDTGRRLAPDVSTQTCADPEGWDSATKFNCPAPAVRAVGVSSSGECCESCASSPGANCTHWTWDGTECTQWSGVNCKQQSAPGATSANIKRVGPSPSPPSPGAMPVYHQMLWDADLYVGRLVDSVKARGMWSNAVILYSADNGGTGDGINWPLRGTKHTKLLSTVGVVSEWIEYLSLHSVGAASFISGGLIPAHLRGTSNGITCHIADWYPTFAGLAGVSGKDDPPKHPLPVDMSEPNKDIYGTDSYPPVDGVDLWPFLMSTNSTNYSAAHPEGLVLSKEVIILGPHKLIVAQNFGWPPVNNWRQPDGSWIYATNETTPPCGVPDLKPTNASLLGGIPGSAPCLFNIRSDASEKQDLGGLPNWQPTVESLWRALNLTILTSRDCSAKGDVKGSEGIGGCSPAELLGNCDAKCAGAYWQTHYGHSVGPICGVPGC